MAWSGDDVVGSGEGVGGGGDCVSVDGTHAEECGEVVYEDVGVNITGASMTNGGEDLHEGSDGVDDCDECLEKDVEQGVDEGGSGVMENGEDADRDGEKKSVDGESGLRLVMECQE